MFMFLGSSISCFLVITMTRAKGMSVGCIKQTLQCAQSCGMFIAWHVYLAACAADTVCRSLCNVGRHRPDIERQIAYTTWRILWGVKNTLCLSSCGCQELPSVVWGSCKPASIILSIMAALNVTCAQGTALSRTTTCPEQISPPMWQPHRSTHGHIVYRHRTAADTASKQAVRCE